MTKVWVLAYDPREILHALNVFKQIYYYFQVVALWGFTEFEIIVVTW